MKKLLLTLGLCLCLTNSSCLGPNNAYNSVRNWNAQATSYDWVNEGIFLGFVILPVYGITLLGDYLIFNTIDYWGENPISDPGPFPSEAFSSK